MKNIFDQSTMKLVIIIVILLIHSCNFLTKENIKVQKMTHAWHNKIIALPTNLPCKVTGKDSVFQPLPKKYKIFTYIDTAGCTACNFRALDWEQIISEADSLTHNVIFLFYAHLNNYNEFEKYIKINRFKYPIFYDYKGECMKQNNLPNHYFYQTFLLDENNKVLLIGKPKPGSKLWELYKKIITE